MTNTWKRASFAITVGDGKGGSEKATVTGYVRHPFGIHRPAPGSQWVVSHIPTGSRLGGNMCLYFTLRAAKAYADNISPLTDWDRANLTPSRELYDGCVAAAATARILEDRARA